MIPYLLKSILCLAILLLVYHVFLEKEKMHRFNRWYLLGSIIFSCLVPLIRFTAEASSSPILQAVYFDFVDAGPQTAFTPSAGGTTPLPTTAYGTINGNNWATVLYAAIAILLLTRFGFNLYRMWQNIRSHRVATYGDAQLVLLPGKTASHSFLNYIFISEADYADKRVEEEVITHELTQVREKHSWDIIFIELLQAVYWFNPLFIFYKKAIRLNHEYLADDAVIKTFEDIPAYQHLLLEKIGFNSNPSLTSSFNYSITKKRFLMMTRSNNRISILLKKIGVFPLLVVAVIVFSSREIIAQQKKEPVKTVTSSQDKKRALPEVLWSYPGDLPITSAAGASKDQLKEFNRIVDETVTRQDADAAGEKEHVNMVRITFKGTAEQRKRLFDIFKQMNAQQRHEAKLGFSKRWEGPKKSIPTEAQLEKWKDASNYGVWIDNKKVNNEVLNNYKASDFSNYSASNLAYTEKMKQDVMKAFNLKTMYKVQLDLMTHQQFAKEVADAQAQPEYNMFYHVIRDEKNNRNVEWRMRIKEL